MAEETAGIKEDGQCDIFVAFVEGLSGWEKSGAVPGCAGQEIQYCLELQKQRFKNKGLEVESRITPRGPLSDSGGAGGENQSCKNRRRHCICQREWHLMRNGKSCYQKKERNTLYVAVTDGGQVTNFYLQKEYGMDRRALTHRIGKWVATGAVLGFACALFPMLAWDSMDYATLLTYPVTGGILGYAVFALKLIGGIMADAVRTIPLLMRTNGTKPQITTIMENFGGSFSYENFEGRVLTLLKMILFTGDVKELPVCEQEVLERSFGDIIDTVYRGAIGFRGYHVKGADCYLDLDVYMRDTYDTGHRIYEKNDVFHMTLCKNIGNPLQEEDWIVTAIWKD